LVLFYYACFEAKNLGKTLFPIINSKKSYAFPSINRKKSKKSLKNKTFSTISLYKSTKDAV